MSNIKLFESKQIRSAWDEEKQKWFFSVQDVVEVLTGTVDAKDYIKKMKNRDTQLNTNWGTICMPVTLGYSLVMSRSFPLTILTSLTPFFSHALFHASRKK